MGALQFLLNVPGRVKGLIFINHGTSFSKEGQRFVSAFGNALDLPVHVFPLEVPEKNQEAVWHDQRNEIFQSHKYPVITAHHLDDEVEQFMLTFLKCGRFKPIPPVNGNVYRPFLFHTKDQLIAYANRTPYGYLEDPDNKNIKRHRNYIRHNVIPNIEKGMGTGLKKVVRKLLIESFGGNDG